MLKSFVARSPNMRADTLEALILIKRGIPIIKAKAKEKDWALVRKIARLHIKLAEKERKRALMIYQEKEEERRYEEERRKERRLEKFRFPLANISDIPRLNSTELYLNLQSLKYIHKIPILLTPLRTKEQRASKLREILSQFPNFTSHDEETAK